MSSLRRAGLQSIAPLLLLALCLSRFGRVMNYNGEAIEQSSTLLHALIVRSSWFLSPRQAKTFTWTGLRLTIQWTWQSQLVRATISGCAHTVKAKKELAVV